MRIKIFQIDSDKDTQRVKFFGILKSIYINMCKLF